MRFVLLLVAALALPGTAHAAYAPLDRPGPPLEVSAAAVDAATRCSPGIANASRAPVLLSPGTGATADENFSWNYMRSLTRARDPLVWDHDARPRPGRHPGGGPVPRARDPPHPPPVGPPRGGDGPQPGRHVDALGTALLARHPRDGGRRDRLRRQQPRHRGRRLPQRLHAGCVAAGSQVELHRRAQQSRRDPRGHLLHRGLHPPRRGGDPERGRQRQLVGARRRGPDHQRGHAGHLPRQHQRALHRRDDRPGGLRAGHGRARPRRPRVGGAGRPRGVLPRRSRPGWIRPISTPTSRSCPWCRGWPRTWRR